MVLVAMRLSPQFQGEYYWGWAEIILSTDDGNIIPPYIRRILLVILWWQYHLSHSPPTPLYGGGYYSHPSLKNAIGLWCK
ncbi:MAG: hypothetical protein N3D76_02410 [Geminocystis sp.]|nr:hypothetical protein [Geminocystis sp.]HIK37584.1 hypothetical protein [Geminocystis sp. M7585_C2015_104]